MKFQLFGSASCPNTLYAINKCIDNGLRSGADFQYFNISAGLAELREFLKHRDSREEFTPYRESGKLGIPCFLFEDGSLAFSYEEAISKAKGGQK